MLIRIAVDNEKCRDAFGCRKCVEACARSVLSLAATVPSLRGVETDPKNYVVVGTHLADCTTCMDCVRLCPEGAIKVDAN